MPSIPVSNTLTKDRSIVHNQQPQFGIITWMRAKLVVPIVEYEGALINYID